MRRETETETTDSTIILNNDTNDKRETFMRGGALCGETHNSGPVNWGRVCVSTHLYMPHRTCHTCHVFTQCEKLKYWHEIQIDETPTDFRHSSRSASVRLTHHVTCPHQLDLQPAQTSSAVSRMLDSRNSTKRLSLSPRLILGGGRG